MKDLTAVISFVWQELNPKSVLNIRLHLEEIEDKEGKKSPNNLIAWYYIFWGEKKSYNFYLPKEPKHEAH